MPVPVVCPNCGARFAAPDQAVGQNRVCPTCGGTITIEAGRQQSKPKAQGRTVVRCDGCGARFAAAKQTAQRRKECPTCGRSIVIPGTDQRTRQKQPTADKQPKSKPSPKSAPATTNERLPVRCGGCGARFAAPGRSAGEKRKCPKCGKLILIPRKGQPPAATSAATTNPRASSKPRQLTTQRPSTGPQPSADKRPTSKPLAGGPSADPSSRVVMRCNGCERRFAAPSQLIGKQRDCPHCGKSITIVDPAQAPAEPVPLPELPPLLPLREAPTGGVADMLTPLGASDGLSPTGSPGALAPLDDFESEYGLAMDQDPFVDIPVETSGVMLPKVAIPKPKPASKRQRRPQERKKRPRASSGDYQRDVIPFGWVAAGCLGLAVIFPNIATPVAFLIILAGCVLNGISGVWWMVLAFSEDVIFGLCYMFVPFYSLFYIFSRKDDCPQAFRCCALGFGLGMLGLVMIMVSAFSSLALGNVPT